MPFIQVGAFGGEFKVVLYSSSIHVARLDFNGIKLQLNGIKAVGTALDSMTYGAVFSKTLLGLATWGFVNLS